MVSRAWHHCLHHIPLALLERYLNVKITGCRDGTLGQVGPGPELHAVASWQRCMQWPVGSIRRFAARRRQGLGSHVATSQMHCGKHVARVRLRQQAPCQPAETSLPCRSSTVTNGAKTVTSTQARTWRSPPSPAQTSSAQPPSSPASRPASRPAPSPAAAPAAAAIHPSWHAVELSAPSGSPRRPPEPPPAWPPAAPAGAA